MTTWFTSDHHFSHENVISYCHRPFDTVEQMDKALIDNWNAVVGQKDMVYHLGDFTLSDGQAAGHYFSQLNGRLYVLKNPWHHDKRWLKDYDPFDPYMTKHGYDVVLLPPMYVLQVDGYDRPDGHKQVIVLCHYPIAEFDRKHYGSWHLHGHSHHNYHPPVGDLVMDVGVDAQGYKPISLDGVAQIMTNIVASNATKEQINDQGIR